MAEVINMPRLSDTMEEGTVASWLKKVGDKVEEGDILGRYRIPVKNNKVDFDLQLPDDSDSSNFSSDQEKDGINLGQSQQNADGDDKTEDDKVN